MPTAEHYARLCAMRDDDAGTTWDLSPNDHAAIRWAAEEVERLRAERDKLIDGCIAECSRQPVRTLANAEDSGVMEHGWEWRYGPHGDFVATKVEAVAAVRKAAGPPAGEGGP